MILFVLVATPVVAMEFTCEQVRSYAVGRTKAELSATAKQMGATPAQMAKGRRCLRGIIRKGHG